MDCYKIARRIMRRIRERVGYHKVGHGTYRRVIYYDNPDGFEYFTLSYDGVAVKAMKGNLYMLEISDPRGIVLFNLRLWLLKLDRMTK